VLFILGGERSGSTWLSNIVDSSPDVEFFMEPFAPHLSIFPGVPERNLYVETPSGLLVEYVQDMFSRLAIMKYLLYRRGGPRLLAYMDRLAIRLADGLNMALRRRPPMRLYRAAELNLNAKGLAILADRPKNREIRLLAAKELRLNFKLGLIARAFPGAKIIVILRDPGAQIASIARLMNLGHLKELSQAVRLLPEYVRSQERFEKFRGLVEHVDWGKDLEYELAVWWAINYDTLLGDCARLAVDYQVIHHEVLCEQPEFEARRIFDFLELEYGSCVRAFVHTSTTTGHSRVGPLDTERDTLRYYRQQLENVESRLLEKARRVLRSVPLVDELSEPAPVRGRA
jgi:hypothetical protein